MGGSRLIEVAATAGLTVLHPLLSTVSTHEETKLSRHDLKWLTGM